MKKLLSFVFFILVAGFYLFTGVDLSLTGAVTSVVEDQGDVAVYFCPQDNCEQRFVQFINLAEESIHCALFDVGLESVQNALLKDIDVKVVTDDRYLEKFDHDFVRTDTWGLMHNKFCIVDNEKVFTGSMNPTSNGAHKNNNNILFITSPTLAQNYEDEFQEMWGGTFKKGESVRNPIVQVGDTIIKNYFCPEDNCAERVKEELRKAEHSIHFMTFSFTHEGIANTLLLKQQEGVVVRGVMEARQVSQYSKFDVLSNYMDVVKDSNKQNMHHKVFIVDEKCVITGSMNPSKGGDERNDENVLIVCNEEIARKYVEEFEKVY